MNLIYALHKTKKLDSRSHVVIAALALPIFRQQLPQAGSVLLSRCGAINQVVLEADLAVLKYEDTFRKKLMTEYLNKKKHTHKDWYKEWCDRSASKRCVQAHALLSWGITWEPCYSGLDLPHGLSC